MPLRAASFAARIRHSSALIVVELLDMLGCVYQRGVFSKFLDTLDKKPSDVDMAVPALLIPLPDAGSTPDMLLHYNSRPCHRGDIGVFRCLHVCICVYA